jgi:hypothetical protein
MIDNHQWIRRLGLGAALVGLLLTAANLYYGDLNQDEGWYLYAARLVAQGEMPYVDFAFTQGPVMPLIYSLAQPLVEHWGLAGGRVFTALLGWLAVLSGVFLAARLAGRDRAALAALLAFILLAVNVYQSYFTTVVKTYALTAFFLSAGFLLLLHEQGRRGRWQAFTAAVALSLAAGTRISAAVALPAAGLYLLARRRARPGHWIWFGIGGAATCGVLFLPFLLLNPESLVFGVFQYHSGRAVDGLGTWLAYRAAFVSRMAQAYFVGAVLGAGVVVAAWARGKRPEPRPTAAESGRPAPGLAAALWATAAAMTLVHGLAPMPYDDYQAAVYPLFAVGLAAALARRWAAAADAGAARIGLLLVFLACTAAAFSSPLNQDWFNAGRDRIWWRLKPQASLRLLQQTADEVRRLAGPEGELLTQDTYLAVEAGLRVPRGLELGPFSYYPEWDDARARRCHVLNRGMLEELLRTAPARVAAFSGYGLAIRLPEVRELPADEQERLWKILEARYRPVRRIPAFGQGATELIVLQRP